MYAFSLNRQIKEACFKIFDRVSSVKSYFTPFSLLSESESKCTHKI